MQLSQKKNVTLFFAAFLKAWTFWQKRSSHRFCNFEITAYENVVRWMSKELRLREHFDKQHGKCAQALFKSASKHLYHIHWSLPSQINWKMSLLLTCQILGLLVNTLPADEKYPVLNRDNLTISIQI